MAKFAVSLQKDAPKPTKQSGRLKKRKYVSNQQRLNDHSYVRPHTSLGDQPPVSRL